MQYNPQFKMGRLVCTKGVKQLIDKHDLDLRPYIVRHSRGDWGDLCEEDQATNNSALKEGRFEQLMSSWSVMGKPFWIITDADGRCTTALLPSEY